MAKNISIVTVKDEEIIRYITKNNRVYHIRLEEEVRLINHFAPREQLYGYVDNTTDFKRRCNRCLFINQRMHSFLGKRVIITGIGSNANVGINVFRAKLISNEFTSPWTFPLEMIDGSYIMAHYKPVK